MKLFFFFIDCTNESLLCYRKRIKYTVYKINKLFLATSCFSMRELMSNCLTWNFGQNRHSFTWKFGQNRHSFTCFINCTLCESSMLQGIYSTSY